MKDFYLTLEEILKEKDINIATAAQLCGLADSTVRSIITRKQKNVALEVAFKLSEGLNVSLERLNGTPEKENTTDKQKAVKIPVLGRVAAGVPLEMVEDIIDTEEIPVSMAKTGEYFGLQIHGDSMEPRIYEGDVVIVRKQDDAESGEVVIVSVNGMDATCKRIMKYENGIQLLSLNSKYSPRMFTNKEIEELPIRILGKVVELRGKLKF